MNKFSINKYTLQYTLRYILYYINIRIVNYVICVYIVQLKNYLIFDKYKAERMAERAVDSRRVNSTHTKVQQLFTYLYTSAVIIDIIYECVCVCVCVM